MRFVQSNQIEKNERVQRHKPQTSVREQKLFVLRHKPIENYIKAIF